VSNIRSTLDQDLLAIRDDILRLGSLVDQATSRAIEAFVKHDNDLAQSVVNDDDVVDEMHAEIEEMVTKTFALQQPMARDLRLLIADLLISNELERMGDHAEGIARTVLRSRADKPVAVPVQINTMLEMAQRMIQRSMDAFVDMSAEKARQAASDDDNVDRLYQELFNMLVTAMSKGKTSVEEGTYLLWAGHNLERIADRVTNICERIVYASTGNVGELNPKHATQEDE
jgi:phosphate transport system protein